MKKYISNMPAWLTILLTASFILSFLLIANPAKQAALISGIAKEKSRNIQLGVFAFFVSWLIYASVLSLKGVFDVNSLPPRVIVFTTIPLFVFLFAIIGSTRLYKRLLQSAPLESLIRIHIFRFEGVLFIILFLYHLLPVKFALSAGLGDMLTALFAIPVARAVSQKKSWSIKAVYAWNIFGILDIVSLMTLATIAAG
ncbi:MAG TPA: hypothetical protein VN721_17235, partial [Flavipsychrobacter sp.]|nr:hypothetical protein [Flavipsychrobacter sp.]